VVYQVGGECESTFWNVWHTIAKHLPFTTKDETVLVNDWKEQFLAEVQEVEMTSIENVRLSHTKKIIAKRGYLTGVNNYVKVFTHATRSRVFVNLLKALLCHRDVVTARVLRRDGETIDYTPSLLHYLTSKFEDANGELFAPLWYREPQILINTISCALNQMYIRDIHTNLAMPVSLRTTPAFRKWGLSLRFLDRTAPSASLHKTVT
jgi:hypothetical protein